MTEMNGKRTKNSDGRSDIDVSIGVIAAKAGVERETGSTIIDGIHDPSRGLEAPGGTVGTTLRTNTAGGPD